MTIIKFRRVHCATCAAPLRRGTYLRCVLECGAALCRKDSRGCVTAHTPNCLSGIAKD